ncbi:hypothetical protein Syun_019818 [Stephania yunnanensis]|uniref:Methyltransferase-like protein 17, mitochondrial n=1 Tax=Stephania yunnanensis TaxID=152371 RepID=A0AAP0NZS4_9MAGN
MASSSSSLLHESAQKIFTQETLRAAAKQSQAIHIVPLRLQRAIKRFITEHEKPNMQRRVLSLSESFNRIKDVNLRLAASTARDLVEDPLKSLDHQSKRWKIETCYGDVGLKYRDDETVAYVASRMPAVYSACHRVLREVKRRLPGFAPSRVLDFGSGTGSVLWAVREVWPRSLERINLVEPSKSMQRASQSLLQGLKNLPLIQSYGSIQGLVQNVQKPDRKHDLVMASYVLGEIPSLKDRITLVRQLWDLTEDVLVLVEPGTPHGFNIISQMRSHILWMEKRRCRKSGDVSDVAASNTEVSKSGAFVVAPCAHDGACPLDKTGKYCHFVQRLERTSSQRSYKRSKGQPLRGFEDEKFCFVALRRGKRPRQKINERETIKEYSDKVVNIANKVRLLGPWPLDGMTFETLKEQHAKRNPEDLEIDYEDLFPSEDVEENVEPVVSYNSDVTETEAADEDEEASEDEEQPANLGSGWGRIIFSPVRRGRQVSMDVCRSTKPDGSEGSFERVVVTQSKNPTLHKQARRSLWGDLWPF